MTTPDAFAVLGITPRFDLSKAEIEAAYLTRIAGAHPDRAVESADAPGSQAPDPAAINRARKDLLNIERRANLMLASIGGPSASDNSDLPDGFLMDIMSVRMEIEEAIASGGDAERAEWQAWADEQRASYTKAVGELFDRIAPENNTPTDSARRDLLDDARQTLNAWRYIERLIEQLDPGYDPASADFAR